MNGRMELDEKYQHIVDDKLERLPSFMNDYYYTMSEKSVKTQGSYLSKDIKFFEFLSNNYNIDCSDPYNFKKVKASAIERFIGETGGETSNRLVYFYAVKDLFNFLLKDEYIDKNPCYMITPPKNKKEIKRMELNEEDIRHIRENIMNGTALKSSRSEQEKMYTRNILLFDMFITTGLRKSSIMALNWDDVDFKHNQLRIFEKGNKERYLPISYELINEIRAYDKLRWDILIDTDSKTDALFVTRRGTRIGRDSIDHFVFSVTDSIGKKMSPHKLRASCATLLIKKTGNIYLVADRLGHANVETTKRYAHLDDEMRREAVKVMEDIFD